MNLCLNLIDWDNYIDASNVDQRDLYGHNSLRLSHEDRNKVGRIIEFSFEPKGDDKVISELIIWASEW